MTIQRKTQATAGEKFNDATSRMASMATELSNKASGQWDKLETIFEERVSRALKKLGVPAAGDIEELVARIDELQRTVAALRGSQGGARAATRKAAVKRPVVKAAARKRAAGRKSASE
jgi:poly(hydroxyalkanoate) granule-associated protein